MYPIIHVCLLILAQLCCKIKLVSFWVHLNVRPTCVIFTNLYWLSVLKYTTSNHASGCILVTIILPEYDFYWDSQGVMEVHDITPSTK